MTQADLKGYIEANFADQMTFSEAGKREPLFELKAEHLLEVTEKLKEDPELQFDFLCNLGGVDTGEQFEVTYHIASTVKKLRLDFKVILDRDKPEIESISPVWPAAIWYERELYELYGFEVKNHPDMRPLLLPEDWDQGFPMRKDWDAPDFVRMPEL